MSAKNMESVPVVMDFEEYAARHRASRGDIGDAGVHKRGRNQSDKQWRRIIAYVEGQTAKAVTRREEIREEYEAAVLRGEIRPLTRIEKIRRNAEGHPDLPSTAAAKRLLEKHEAALGCIGGA